MLKEYMYERNNGIFWKFKLCHFVGDMSDTLDPSQMSYALLAVLHYKHN